MEKGGEIGNRSMSDLQNCSLKVKRASLVVTILILLFQNCAKNPKYATDMAVGNIITNLQCPAQENSKSNPAVGALPSGGQPDEGVVNCNANGDANANTISYPSSSTITLKADQAITLKIQKPAEVENASDWHWYAEKDGYTLIAYKGSVIDIGSFVLVSLSVRKDISEGKQFKLFFINKSEGSPRLADEGIAVKVDLSSVSSFAQDHKAELCNDSNAELTSATLDRASSKDPIFFVDKGRGISSVVCSFYVSQSWKTYDCFNTSVWPSNWTSLYMYVNIIDRCAGTNGIQFSP